MHFNVVLQLYGDPSVTPVPSDGGDVNLWSHGTSNSNTDM